MENKIEDRQNQKKFDFTLYLNDNVIVQRLFNVFGFNPNAVNSMNFKEVVDYNVNLIKLHLKNKTNDYMTENAKQFYENPSFFENENKKDVIRVVIRYGDKVLTLREWDAMIYPSKVRHSIDVREHIYMMITNIQRCLSEKNNKLETTYLGYNLAI
jgi:hypothetical protein